MSCSCIFHPRLTLEFLLLIVECPFLTLHHVQTGHLKLYLKIVLVSQLLYVRTHSGRWSRSITSHCFFHLSYYFRWVATSFQKNNSKPLQFHRLVFVFPSFTQCCSKSLNVAVYGAPQLPHKTCSSMLT